MRRRLFIAATAALAATPAAAQGQLLDRLREGGLVILMRHAVAPGTGDPSGMRLNDCSTQRNLDERGRAQARAIGDFLRAERIPVGQVLTSQWCRSRETAELLGFGEPLHLQPLDSFFEDRSRRDAHVAGIRAFVERWSGPGNAVLVTHQVNVTGVTGVFPRSGELVVVAPGGEVLGRLSPA